MEKDPWLPLYGKGVKGGRGIGTGEKWSWKEEKEKGRGKKERVWREALSMQKFTTAPLIIA